MRSRFRQASVLFLYLCATLQLIRFYIKNTISYLNMPAYLAGKERLPFQERILPILFLRPLFASPWVAKFFHNDGVFTADRGPVYLLSLVAFLVAAFYTQKLYEAVLPNGSFRLAVYPTFVFAMTWTYCIHTEANFSYPYDFPAVAFFAAGLYYVYTRKFFGVVAVVLVGSFNRETTLFLIFIYLLDCMSSAAIKRTALTAGWNLRSFNLRIVPWLRVSLLCLIWISIKIGLGHRYSANDHSESYPRAWENMVRLKPRLLPALLNICGYMLPIVVLFRDRIESVRFRSYLLVLPLWVAVMLNAGLLIETRIYGELCSFTAVGLVLILESTAKSRSLQLPNFDNEMSDNSPRLAA